MVRGTSPDVDYTLYYGDEDAVSDGVITQASNITSLDNDVVGGTIPANKWVWLVVSTINSGTVDTVSVSVEHDAVGGGGGTPTYQYYEGSAQADLTSYGEIPDISNHVLGEGTWLVTYSWTASNATTSVVTSQIYLNGFTTLLPNASRSQTIAVANGAVTLNGNFRVTLGASDTLNLYQSHTGTGTRAVTGRSLTAIKVG